jgi:hypothetical protein
MASPVAVPFPYITPSARQYSPGEYPEERFVSQNGSTTRVRYGNRRSQSKLSLTFANIDEEQAVEILECYDKVNGTEPWNYIRFNRGDDGNTGRGGAWEGVKSQTLIESYYQENAITASGTYWRFSQPPVVRTNFPGRVTVTCEFESFLDA